MSASEAAAAAAAPPAAAAPSASAAAAEATKASARSSRLRLSNGLKEQLAAAWQKEGQRACDPAVRVYWLCRQASGLAVVLPTALGGCRDEHAAMAACLTAHARDAQAEAVFRARRMAEMADARAAAASAAAAAAPAAARG